MVNPHIFFIQVSRFHNLMYNPYIRYMSAYNLACIYIPAAKLIEESHHRRYRLLTKF